MTDISTGSFQGFDFSEALKRVKEGKRVGRQSWKNALGVFLVQGSQFQVNRAPLNQFYPEGTEITYRPHIDVINADGSIGTWSPSNGDVLANDWYELKGPEASGTNTDPLL